MAGHAQEVELMWKTLGAKIDLDPPLPLDQHVYLGCTQHEYPADPQLVQEKSNSFQSIIRRTDDVSNNNAACPSAANGGDGK